MPRSVVRELGRALQTEAAAQQLDVSNCEYDKQVYS